jgi:protoheme IX farnesyltransferase
MRTQTITDPTLTQAMSDPRPARPGDYIVLLKPRVMSLVVFTALVGLLVAPVPMDPIRAALSILCIALGGGASGALNMWWDADIDAKMRRTANRPIPAGRVNAHEALILGLVLSVLSVGVLSLVANPVAGALLAFTIFFYVVIYSVLLKRATPQNIVIGGASGALPPMIGWACATGGISVDSLLMFALIFMWTPPHFWALALFVKSDYGRAGIPMLTETHGRPATRRHILGYTLVLIPTSLALGLTSIGGPVYLAVAGVLNLRFLIGAWAVFRRTEDEAEADNQRAERRLFRLSLSYLFLHFCALLVEALLHAQGLSGW